MRDISSTGTLTPLHEYHFKSETLPIDPVSPLAGTLHPCAIAIPISGRLGSIELRGTNRLWLRESLSPGSTQSGGISRILLFRISVQGAFGDTSAVRPCSSVLRGALEKRRFSEGRVVHVRAAVVLYCLLQFFFPGSERHSVPIANLSLYLCVLR